MPLLYIKPIKVLKKTASISFFTPKTQTSNRNTNRLNYITLERREAIFYNPL
jgi:hypothetical protein